MMTLFFKFITENYISDLIALATDIVFQIRTHAEKERQQVFVDVTFIILAFFIILSKSLIIYVTIMKFGKQNSVIFSYLMASTRSD